MISESSNTVTDDDYFIIDSAATASVVTKLGLFEPNSLRIFGKTEIVSILGISGDAGLATPGVGNLPTPFDNLNALYVPNAIFNILSWWSIRKTHYIKVRHQMLHPPRNRQVRLQPNTVSATERVFCISHISQLQKLGLNRKASIRAASCQDLHECLGFRNPEVMKAIINRRGNKDFTNADFDFWLKHYHGEFCRGCPACSNAPPHSDSTTRERDQIGQLVHADLFQVVSKLPSGCFTAIAFIDDASSHKSVVVLEDKTKGSLMDAVYDVTSNYSRSGNKLIELRTDGEPVFQSLTAPLKNIHGIQHSFCEEYRHEASAERGIQTLEKKFLAFIHGADVPVPTLLITGK